MLSSLLLLGLRGGLFSSDFRNNILEETLGRPGRRWEDNKMNLGETEWRDVDWICLDQDRFQWRALVNLRVPWKLGNLLTGWATI